MSTCFEEKKIHEIGMCLEVAVEDEKRNKGKKRYF